MVVANNAGSATLRFGRSPPQTRRRCSVTPSSDPEPTQTFRASIFRHSRSGELATGVGVFQPFAGQSRVMPACCITTFSNQINLLANDGGTCTARSRCGHDLAEQPVLAECGGDDGRAERQHVDAESADDVPSRPLPEPRTSTCTPRMYRGPTAGGSNWAPGRCRRRRHTGGGFGDAEFGIGREPDFRAAIFRHGRSGELADRCGCISTRR